MNKEKLLVEHYQNSKIYRLRAERKRSKLQKVMKYLKFIYIDSQGCILENLIDDNGWLFYLIQQEPHYYLVAVSGETIKSQAIVPHKSINAFEYGEWIFFNKGLISGE